MERVRNVTLMDVRPHRRLGKKCFLVNNCTELIYHVNTTGAGPSVLERVA